MGTFFRKGSRIKGEKMIKRLKKEERQKIGRLFEGWEETMIWSYFQGYMGEAWTDEFGIPQMAGILVGDFCFLAGNSKTQEAAVLVENMLRFYHKTFLLFAPKEEGWGDLIEQIYPKQAKKILRYAIKKEKDIFDRKKLEGWVNELGSEFKLEQIDAKWYRKCQEQDWTKDFCSQFQGEEDFLKRGLGVLAIKDGSIVSGASSYTVYRNGIEIEVDTKKEYRRKGLATACAAKLILLCLERGWYPSWDAANMDSVNLAQKLGYHLDREYVTYAVKLEGV